MNETFIPENTPFIDDAISDNLNSDEFISREDVVDEIVPIFNESSLDECVENNLSFEELTPKNLREDQTPTSEESITTPKPRGRNRKKNKGNNSIIRMSEFSC